MRKKCRKSDRKFKAEIIEGGNPVHVQTIRLHEKWKKFILQNREGIEIHVLNYGGIIQKIMVPDRFGKVENIVLGYEKEKDYETDPYYLGALIGPVAGRIQGAEFQWNDQTFKLEKNEGNNHLHGGSQGFHQVIWEAEPLQTPEGVGVKLCHERKDGESGYPGNIKVTVIYWLNRKNELLMDYQAVTDRTTPVTLTNHTYFNLSGNLKDTVGNHRVRMNASRFAELDEALLPTGRILSVRQTPFDFGQGRNLKDGFTGSHPQNRMVGGGYDHYFFFASNPGCVSVEEIKSGRMMQIITNQPGMVLYTSNQMKKDRMLAGGWSRKYLGVCFETQASPASLHDQRFPSVLLKRDEVYRKKTVFSFGIK